MDLPSDKQVIILSYCRAKELVDGGHPLSGDITLHARGETTALAVFTLTSYRKMISTLHDILNEQPSDVLVGIHRSDSRAPAAILSDSEAALIRVDAVQYIRSTTTEPRRVVVGGSRLKEIITSPFRVGYDTLADAFGEAVYLRVKKAQIECPFTGRWVDTATLPLTAVPHGRWAEVSTNQILENVCDRYYLPRSWNMPGPWIERAVLQQMLEEFRRLSAVT